MIRRFNFTERKRIDQERVKIEVTEAADGGPASFKAEINFDGMGLPADAPVTIEAYRGRMAMRFPWGTAGALTPHPDRRLVTIPDNPSFRVKVVAPDGSGALLAMANRIRPRREERHGSLLWLKPSDELGKEVWRLDFGDGSDPPTLLINRSVPGIETAARNDDAFHALVFPEVLRAVLVRALITDDADLDDEEGDWGGWLRFAHSLHDAPLRSGDDDDRDARMKWIDEAVEAFTRKHFHASDIYAEALGQR